MGRITIDSSTLKLDDRTMAHLEVVIIGKLRRGESFFFTWVHEVSLGSGKDSKWMHPQLDLDFRFDDHRTPEINPAWVEALMRVAYTPAGLQIVPETEHG